MCRYTNYTTVWNALDYPAATFPVTTVDPTLDTKKSRHVFYDDFDKGIYDMCEYSLAPSDFCMSR
jgi:amidase